MEKLFKISEIAKFLSITTTTLRHYEKEGIIQPCCIDENTKYRYYTSKNISRISYVILLRRVGITIPQIREYFDNKSNIDNILFDLKEQQKRLENTIAYFNSIKGNNNSNKINIVTLPKTKYICEKHQINSINDAYNKMQCFVNSYLTKSQIDTPLFYLETTSTFEEIKNLDVVIGIDVFDSDIQMFSRNETKALELLHDGSYENIQNSHNLMINYAEKNKIKLKGNIIHYFLESFAVRGDNYTNFITKIVMPIEA